MDVKGYTVDVKDLEVAAAVVVGAWEEVVHEGAEGFPRQAPVLRGPLHKVVDVVQHARVPAHQRAVRCREQVAPPRVLRPRRPRRRRRRILRHNPDIQRKVGT